MHKLGWPEDWEVHRHHGQTHLGVRITDCGQTPALSPLRWWRQADLSPRSTNANAALRASLQSIAMFGEPDWHAAAHGDAAATVRIALRLAFSSAVAPLMFDLAASALLLCAVEGNAAAQVTLQYLQRRFGSLTAVKQDKTAAGGVGVA